MAWAPGMAPNRRFRARRGAFFVTEEAAEEASAPSSREKRLLARELAARAPAAAKCSRFQKIFIDALPDQVLLEIFRLLELDTLAQVAQVCRRWRGVAAAKILWCNVNLDFLRHAWCTPGPSLVLQIAPRLGPHTKRLVIPTVCVDERVVKMIRRRCTRLCQLDISRQRPGVHRVSSVVDAWFWSHAEEDEPCGETDDWPLAVLELPNSLASLSISPTVLPRWTQGPFPQLRSLQLLENNEFERLWGEADIPPMLDMLPALEALWISEPFASWRQFDLLLQRLPPSVRRLDLGLETDKDDFIGTAILLHERSLANLGSLTHLWLRVTDSVPHGLYAALVDACPHLRAFGLRKAYSPDDIEETGAGLANLASLSKLQHLALGWTWVTEELIGVIESLQLLSLQLMGELGAGENAISGFLRVIAESTTLEHLHLRVYRPTLMFPHLFRLGLDLRGLTALRSLRLRGHLEFAAAMTEISQTTFPLLRELHFTKAPEETPVFDFPCVSLLGSRVFGDTRIRSNLQHVFTRVRHLRLALAFWSPTKADITCLRRWFPNLERLDLFVEGMMENDLDYRRELRRSLLEALNLPLSCLQFRHMGTWSDAGFEYPF